MMSVMFWGVTLYTLADRYYRRDIAPPSSGYKSKQSMEKRCTGCRGPERSNRRKKNNVQYVFPSTVFSVSLRVYPCHIFPILGLLFCPEYGDSSFLRNVGNGLSHYMMPHTRIQ
jgi:hypothetical protein